MNQHDQMREALEAFQVLATLTQNTTALHVIREQCRKLHKALAAEPAPLVRLTEHQLEQLGCSYAEDFEFANAIMDAMERVNRRQLDQTPNSPSE